MSLSGLAAMEEVAQKTPTPSRARELPRKKELRIRDVIDLEERREDTSMCIE